MPPTEPAPLSDAAADGLPAWARAGGDEPGRSWWASARRWFGALEPSAARPGQTTESAPGPGADVLPAMADGAEGARRTGRSPAPPRTGAALALVERLRRSVAHALRHPGYGFALVVLALDWPEGTRRRAELARQATRRLELTLRPGDALLAADGDSAGAQRYALVLDGLARPGAVATVVGRVRRELAEPFLAGREPLRCRARLALVHVAPGQAPSTAEGLLAEAEARLAGLGPDDDVAGLPPPEPGAGAAGEPEAAALAALHKAHAGGELPLQWRPWMALDGTGLFAVEPSWPWPGAPAGRGGVASLADLQAASATDAESERADALWAEVLAAAAPVLAEAAAAAGDTQRRLGGPAPGPRLVLALSPAQQARADAADHLAEAVTAAGLAPEQLLLLWPVSAAPSDRNLLERQRALVARGFGLVLDGVGAGGAGSSLAALASSPVSAWRLAPGLLPASTGAAAAGGHRRVLLEGILSLAQAQGVFTVAGRLDSAAALAAAHQLGLEVGHGDAIGTPMAPAALSGWTPPQPPAAASGTAR